MSTLFASVILSLGAGEKIELPKVERDYNIIRAGDRAGKTFAELIPPASVQKIVLTLNRGLKAPFDADRLMNDLFKKPTAAKDWGLRATESTIAEFAIVTKKGDFYRVEVLRDALTRGGEVTAALLYGKGFACRFALDMPAKKNDLEASFGLID